MKPEPILIYALAEEIGDPDLFVGREKEMARLLRWADGAKRRISLSTGILSRRKKGKTALLQRFFNILYTRNDPQLIPFYYRIPEELLSKTAFAKTFYRRLLSQYFAFTTRTPEWVNQVLSFDELVEVARDDPPVATDLGRMFDILETSPEEAWGHARDAGHRISAVRDVRILQILDEFQYMNRWIVSDDNRDRVEELCYSYMGTAESKFSPQLVAGSYIGWLSAILSRMTGRYHEWRLEGLADEEALAAVYNYAYTYQVAITDEVAPYIAEVCDNDPFYIASTVRNRVEEKDLTTPEGVRDALALETIEGKGDIARVWREYLWDAFARVNDTNARKIVLYLARHEPDERGRDQILADLDLDMTDQQLEERLHKLVKADILAQGSSNFHYSGLGDRIFAMVFRRIYGVEIERVSARDIEEDFKRELAKAKGQIAFQKGLAAEYRIRYRLLAAAQRGATLSDIVIDSQADNAQPSRAIGDFAFIRKARFHLDQARSVEIDLHARSGHERPTAFLFYSESGLGDATAAALIEAGVLILDPKKLARYETAPGF